jgi:lipopolysaccharide transport system permease protein
LSSGPENFERDEMNSAENSANHSRPPARNDPAAQSPEDFDHWIEAGRAERHYWLDLWRYRELFVILAWRDIAVRYKQTVAGAAWAIIQPLLNMIIMTIIFGRVAGLPSVGDAPYAIMVFAAMLPWQFFANAVSNASSSIVNNAGMISKVYFPRLIVPCATVGVSLVDFTVSLSILAGLMVWYEFLPTWRLLMLPAFILLAIVAALGPSMLITALMVRFRDFRFLVPFIIQFGMFVSPVAYSTAVVRDKLGEFWFFIYCLNPLVGVIEGFRWAVLGTGESLSAPAVAMSLGLSVVLFIVGILYFRKTERSFADII